MTNTFPFGRGDVNDAVTVADHHIAVLNVNLQFHHAAGQFPRSVADRNGEIRALFRGPLAWDRSEGLALFEALKKGQL